MGDKLIPINDSGHVGDDSSYESDSNASSDEYGSFASDNDSDEYESESADEGNETGIIEPLDSETEYEPDDDEIKADGVQRDSGRSFEQRDSARSFEKPDSANSFESYETDNGSEGTDTTPTEEQIQSQIAKFEMNELRSVSEGNEDFVSDSDSDGSSSSHNVDEDFASDSNSDGSSSSHNDDSHSGSGSSHSSDESGSESNSGTGSDSSGGSEWEDGSNDSQSQSSNHDDDTFNDEPVAGSKKKDRKKAKTSIIVEIDSDDSDDSDSSGESFTDEPRDKSKPKRRQNNRKESWPVGDDGDLGNWPTTRAFESQRMKSLISSMDLDNIAKRESLIVDREKTVNTREKSFMRWFFAVGVIVCIGAIILITLYFVGPLKSKKTSSPTSLPIAMPSMMPTNLLRTNQPSKSPVPTASPIEGSCIDEEESCPDWALQDECINNSAYMSVFCKKSCNLCEPDIPEEPEEILVMETTFPAYVPNGKAEGVTTESLEEDLTDVFDTLLPQVLEEILESDENDVIVRTRYLLRRLQEFDTNSTKIEYPIEVDVLEIECQQGAPASDLCVEVIMIVRIVSSSDSITPASVLELADAYSSAIVDIISDGSLQEADPDLILVPSVDQIVTIRVESTEAPSVSMESMEPTMELSMDPNQTQLPVSTNSIQPSIAPSDVSSIYTSIEVSSNETGSEDNETQSPSPSISEKDTLAPSDPSCIDANDACEELSDTGECSRTKCSVWALENECVNNPNYMNVNCKKSCGLCDGSGPIEGPCVDENERCGEWASENECINNPNYMNVNCKKSCGLCDGSGPIEGPCLDENERCGEWASENECIDNSEYMNVYCKNSCGLCGCEDKTNRCSEASPETGECPQTVCEKWASEGECVSNPDYMNINCRKSCDLC